MLGKILTQLPPLLMFPALLVLIINKPSHMRVITVFTHIIRDHPPANYDLSKPTERGVEPTCLSHPIYIILPDLAETLVTQYSVVQVCTGIKHIVYVLRTLELKRQLQNPKSTFHHTKRALNILADTL